MLLCFFFFVRRPQGFDRLVQPEALVTSGPYAFVQHPIYTSYMALFVGHCLRSARSACRQSACCAAPAVLHGGYLPWEDWLTGAPARPALHPAAAWAALRRLRSSWPRACCTMPGGRRWRRSCWMPLLGRNISNTSHAQGASCRACHGPHPEITDHISRSPEHSSGAVEGATAAARHVHGCCT